MHVVHVLIAVKEESSKRGGGEDFIKMIKKRADGESRGFKKVKVLKNENKKFARVFFLFFFIFKRIQYIRGPIK